MPKSAKAKRAVSTTTVTPATAKPAKRAINVAADKASKLATAPALPVTTATTDAAVPMPRGLTRDAAGIVRAATNYAVYSDRDTAYLVFFGAVCRANSGSATLRQIHDTGITRTGMPDRKRFNPNYSGSGKATDVGAINRLIKAGYFTRSADGNTIAATKLATESKAYHGKA